MEAQKLYDIPEAAGRWGVSVATVRAMVFKRLIDIVRIGRRVKVPEREINRVIEDGFQPRRIRTDLGGNDPHWSMTQK